MSTEIIDAVDPDVLRAELTGETRLTGFHDLEVHMFDGPECPGVLREIGRIRETEYRREGAGRNQALDLDRHDTEAPRYAQIVSFDREVGELVAMYRAMHCGRMLEAHELSCRSLRTACLFDFTPDFVATQLSTVVELGRSVVNRKARRAIQGLFSVWSGLGALVRAWPEIDAFFGNVTFYRSLPERAVRVLWHYLCRHHGEGARGLSARDGCLVALEPPGPDEVQCTETFDSLVACASREGWQIPPILVSYLKACPGLQACDIAMDADFGDTVEAAILVPVDRVTRKTRRRFIDTD